jgi:hypothetical protein
LIIVFLKKVAIFLIYDTLLAESIVRIPVNCWSLCRHSLLIFKNGVSRFSETILMNAPLNSDSSQYATAETGHVSAPAGYAPAVPISVYRELATELKTTQMTLDALTQQNQQLLRQNKLLRTEIQRFVQAAEQLGHFAGVMPPEVATGQPNMMPPGRVQEVAGEPDLFAKHAPQEPTPRSESTPQRHPQEPASRPAAKSPRADEFAAPDPRHPVNASAIVHRPQERQRDRAHPPHVDPNKQRLFTEQPEGMRPFSKVASRPDLGNLWLATTILLVVVSAFGAGFLIMRPLLGR